MAKTKPDGELRSVFDNTCASSEGRFDGDTY